MTERNERISGLYERNIQVDFNRPELNALPFPIETDRLILRPPLPGDGAELHKAVEETWDSLNRWMIWAQARMSAEDCEVNIREAFAKFILGQDIRLHGYEKETGRLVLSSGLHRFDWRIRRFETGYWVRESAQGQGYATEACAAILQYAFDVLKARHVEIEHADGNDASRRVIEKLGFVKEGVLKGALANHSDPDGGVYDSHVYSLTDAEHLKGKFSASWPQKAWEYRR
jgi:RimJ/RimL family protein N-acetyltransferase